MISHDQLAKAFTRQRVTASPTQIAAILADVLPNPQSGFSTSGIMVWGDSRSIDEVRNWHHTHTTQDQLINSIVSRCRRIVATQSQPLNQSQREDRDAALKELDRYLR